MHGVLNSLEMSASTSSSSNETITKDFPPGIRLYTKLCFYFQFELESKHTLKAETTAFFFQIRNEAKQCSQFNILVRSAVCDLSARNYNSVCVSRLQNRKINVTNAHRYIGIVSNRTAPLCVTNHDKLHIVGEPTEFVFVHQN